MLLFTNRAAALKTIRKSKTARCRIFASVFDAAEYASKPLPRVQQPLKTKRSKKRSKNVNRNYVPSRYFRTDLDTIFEDSPPWNPEDMRLLYRFIKNNEVDRFTEFIWTYPHLLYCNEALPPVRHEGSQYNLLQAAIIFQSPVFCALILEILEHPLISGSLFPSKRDEDCSDKMKHILRLYLNSGLKENGDTPLHYASRFGLIDCCKILLSHPLCETTKTNNEGYTPLEVVCKNSGGIANPVFGDLLTLFDTGLWYVPIFRSKRSLTAIIGKPFECKDFIAVAANSGQSSEEELGQMRKYILHAFAGPMSKTMAFRFYIILSKPSISTLFTYGQQMLLLKIKALEPKKGIERIARSLAKDWNIEWKEFFPILDVFINLATAEGMTIFENYWESRWEHQPHCGPLPLSKVDVEPKDMSLAVIRLYPLPHVNPLCNKMNLLLCYHQKFIKAGAQDIIEEYDLMLPSPSSGVDGRRQGSNSDIYMNGSSLSELDKEVYMSLMQEFSAQLYPNAAKWKKRMEAELQSESVSLGMENFSNVYEYDALKPIPVPHIRDS